MARSKPPHHETRGRPSGHTLGFGAAFADTAENARGIRANPDPTDAPYSQPVLGLIFLRFAEVRFAAQRARLDKTAAKRASAHSPRRGSRADGRLAELLSAEVIKRAKRIQNLIALEPPAESVALEKAQGAPLKRCLEKLFAEIESGSPGNRAVAR